MAYPTCPGCREPQMVADEAVEYRCFTCGTEVRFFACPECGHRQALPMTWTAFTCAQCQRRVDVPRQIPYPERVKAARSNGVANPYPRI